MSVLSEDSWPLYISSRRENFPLQKLRPIWSSNESTSAVPTEAARIEKGEKTMARRKLTLEEQLKGVRAAMRSRQTPPQLKEGLKRRAEELARRLKANSELSRKPKSDDRVRELLGL